MNFEKKIDKLKAKVSELEHQLADLETQRRLAILDRASVEKKEQIRKRHIDTSFELLEVKDAIRVLEQKRRALENNAISEVRKREIEELQAVRDGVIKRFAQSFKGIEELRSRLNG